MSRCERCGCEFGCGAGTESCWCASIAASDKLRAELAREFTRCLCPACLEELVRYAAASGRDSANSSAASRRISSIASAAGER
jgi:hypothetical protein